MDYEEFNNFIEEMKIPELDDGIYDVTGLVVKEPTYYDELPAFKKKYPDCVVGSAYNTDCCLLIEKRPKKISIKDHVIGCGFNYGATAVIKDCPKDILILAEND